MKRGRKTALNYTPSLGQFTCTIDKKLYRLGDDEKKAKKTFAFLLSKEKVVDNPNPPFAVIADKWLEHVKLTCSAGRYRNAVGRLSNFCDFIGTTTRVDSLKPEMLEKWVIERHIYKGGTVRLYKALILAALNWAASYEVHLIPKNPLKGIVKLPEGDSRGADAYWTPEVFEQVKADVNKHFQDFLDGCAWTGARPGVIRRVEARHYIKSLKILNVEDLFNPKSKKKTKIVRLNKKACQLIERLSYVNPYGPIFRNHFGKPYTDSAVTQMIDKVKKRAIKNGKPLPEDLSVYGLRHTFATNFIKTYPDKLELLREILGHKDLEMIRKHYSHLCDQHAYLSEVMEFDGL